MMELNIEIPQLVLIQAINSSRVEFSVSLFVFAQHCTCDSEDFSFLQHFLHFSEFAPAAWGCLHLDHRCEESCSGEKQNKRPLIYFAHERRQKHCYRISLFFSMGFRYWNFY